MVDLEYSEILDAYRVDLWGHGTYVNFSVDEDDSLVLDKTTFNTGEEYVNGDETYEILATVSGDCTWNSRSRHGIPVQGCILSRSITASEAIPPENMMTNFKYPANYENEIYKHSNCHRRTCTGCIGMQRGSV